LGFFEKGEFIVLRIVLRHIAEKVLLKARIIAVELVETVSSWNFVSSDLTSPECR
jgi:hypothetical protein